MGGKREFLAVRNTLLHHTIEELTELDVADGGMLTEQFQCLLDEAIVTGANCRRPSDNKGVLSLEKSMTYHAPQCTDTPPLLFFISLSSGIRSIVANRI